MKIETYRWVIVKRDGTLDSSKSGGPSKNLNKAMLYSCKEHAETWSEEGDKVKKVKVTVEYNG